MYDRHARVWRTEKSEPGVHCASASVRHLIIFAPLFTGLYRNYFPEASVHLRLSRNPNSVMPLRIFSFVFGPLSIIISSPDSGSGKEVRVTSILFEPIRISTKSRFVATTNCAKTSSYKRDASHVCHPSFDTLSPPRPPPFSSLALSGVETRLELDAGHRQRIPGLIHYQ